jgi:hypothetical protein
MNQVVKTIINLLFFSDTVCQYYLQFVTGFSSYGNWYFTLKYGHDFQDHTLVQVRVMGYYFSQMTN